jgi:hypothetical protein
LTERPEAFQRLGPKQFQQTGELAAARDLFAREYARAVSEGDDFIGGHYVDEVAATLAKMHRGSVSRDQMRTELMQALTQACQEAEIVDFDENLNDDVEVALQKRYAK